MIMMVLGLGAVAALIGWSACMFWLGRATAGKQSGADLSGVPPSLSMSRPAVLPPTPFGARDLAGLSSDQLAAIRSEITRGNKISAIKLMREATGLGLTESKRAVEAMGG